MKYKTTIKLITEAKDKNEATEIAGDYLSGNLTTGVDMKFRTVPARNNVRWAGIACVIILIAGSLVIHLSIAKHSQGFFQNLPGDSVIQPPLKTSSYDLEHSDFKKEWQIRHTQEALDSLRK